MDDRQITDTMKREHELAMAKGKYGAEVTMTKVIVGAIASVLLTVAALTAWVNFTTNSVRYPYEQCLAEAKGQD